MGWINVAYASSRGVQQSRGDYEESMATGNVCTRFGKPEVVTLLHAVPVSNLDDLHDFETKPILDHLGGCYRYCISEEKHVNIK